MSFSLLSPSLNVFLTKSPSKGHDLRSIAVSHLVKYQYFQIARMDKRPRFLNLLSAAIMADGRVIAMDTHPENKEKKKYPDGSSVFALDAYSENKEKKSYPDGTSDFAMDTDSENKEKKRYPNWSSDFSMDTDSKNREKKSYPDGSSIFPLDIDSENKEKKSYPDGSSDFFMGTDSENKEKKSYPDGSSIFPLDIDSENKEKKSYPDGSSDFALDTSSENTKKKRYPDESSDFSKEMHIKSMKFHSTNQAIEGEQEPDMQPVSKWEPTIEGYLKFLVDSKVVYEALENIVKVAACPLYVVFRATDLERSESLESDLEWFNKQGYTIPEPSLPGISYACYLQSLSEKDPLAFICHLYNFYLAHTAGGQIIGRKVAGKILNGKELEFYKWSSDLTQLRKNFKGKLNQVAENWSREEKDLCLEETAKCFQYSNQILHLIIACRGSLLRINWEMLSVLHHDPSYDSCMI